MADDRTAKARIRDAAIRCVAEDGISETTVRKVAASAGVSPGLVIHHFGSMENLRSACDEHVARAIREAKENAMSAGPGLDVFGMLRDTTIGSAARYLARVLSSGSPAVDSLVDDLIADAEGYFDRGVETGMLRPSDDPRGRAVVLVLWSLGGLVLHDHFNRLIGVDLTDPDIGTSPNIAAYMGPVYEILGTGIFTEALAEHLQSVVAEAGSGDSESASTSPSP
jgi:AcrR family transcriptional regulator